MPDDQQDRDELRRWAERWPTLERPVCGPETEDLTRGLVGVKVDPPWESWEELYRFRWDALEYNIDYSTWMEDWDE